ncbi:hypothetical protein CRYUN_Cryun01aG0150100 [Craigia yunnanensis]
MEKALNRQKVLLDHLRPSFSSPQSHESTDALFPSICAAGDSAAYHRTSAVGNDVVIVAACRTAICKAKRGGFKDTLADDLLAPVLKALMDRAKLNPSEVGDVVVDTVPIRTVNRQCSSGLQAVADVAACIKAGFYDIGIGTGLESMTIDKVVPGVGKVNPKVESFAQARDCLLPMGITSENVAQRYGVTRQEQDQAAVDSHWRAAEATASGKFKDESIPIEDPKTGEEKPVTVLVDDGICPNTNMQDLAKLKPVFRKDGATTAGNASQVSDGAGAVLLMKRSLAMQKGLPILGVFRSFAAVGVDPAVMGIGPAVAYQLPLSLQAFASQFVYCCKKLELDPEKVNVNGGAIAFGHPLGATGARCVGTLLYEMKRHGKDCRFGVISMCIGSGMGAAAVFERGDSADEFCNARAVKIMSFYQRMLDRYVCCYLAI